MPAYQQLTCRTLAASLTRRRQVRYSAGADPVRLSAQDVTPGSQWLSINNRLDGERFSPLLEITIANASRLKEVCRVQIDGPTSFQAGLIVADGVIYTNTGRETLALDAATGKLLWKNVIGAPRLGESASAAPLAWQGVVYMGIAGSELGARGRVMAYDAQTGRELWRFNTVPMGNERGAETWKRAKSAKTGGGGVWYEHFPVRYWNEWLDERVPTILVQSLEPGAKPRDLLAPTALAHQPGFAGIAADAKASMSLSPIWSPDGSDVIFTATTERWRAVSAFVGYHLYRLSLQPGHEPTLVVEASGDYEEPRFAPDGRALFFKYAPQDVSRTSITRLKLGVAR